MIYYGWYTNYIGGNEKYMNSLHVKMNVSQGQFSRHVHGNAKTLGLLPGQPKILEYVEKHQGCQQSEICEAWDLDKSTVSGLLNRMERDDLLRITKSTEDTRKKEIRLSDKGMERWSKMKQYIEAMERTALKDVNQEEFDIFISVLDRIYHNLKSEELESDKEQQNEEKMEK